MTRFLLDSGDPVEYREISKLAKEQGSELWGGTTNPSLIAKKLTGTKISSQKEAFELQKKIVLEILEIVSGSVSAEVYADETTTAESMTEQGKEIATWHKRIHVKLPTTLEGFKARTELRKANIPVNNTLVFTQEQSFAVCLHEKIMQQSFGSSLNQPCFISPFVGRLDDLGLNGMDLVKHSITTKNKYGYNLWMLEASVRTVEHFKKGIELGSEIITSPLKMYKEWFAMKKEQQESIDCATYAQNLQPIPYWQPSDELLSISTLETFMNAIETSKLNIHHDLTDKGLVRFAKDWNSLIQV